MGEISPENLAKLRKVLDKFVKDGRIDAGGSAAKGDWVTIQGTHVLLGEGGVAMSGGKLKGMTFANAKSQKKGNAGVSGGSSSGGSSGSKSSGGSSAKSGGDVYASGKNAFVNAVKASGKGKEEAASYLDKMETGTRVSYTSYGAPLTYEKQANGKWAAVKENGSLNKMSPEKDSSSVVYFASIGGTSPDSVSIQPATSKSSATPSVNSTPKPSEQSNFVNPVNIGNPFASAATPQPAPAAKPVENAQKSASSSLAQATSQPSATPKKYSSLAEERKAVLSMSSEEKLDYLVQNGYMNPVGANNYRKGIAKGSAFDIKAVNTKTLQALDKMAEDERILSQHQAGIPQSRGHVKTASMPQPIGDSKSSRLTLQTMLDTGLSRSDAIKINHSVHDFTETSYSDIRATQRSGNPSEKAQAIEQYIAAAPKWNGGTIYRGINAGQATTNKILSSVQSGEPFDLGGVTSWSSTKSVAEGFIKKGRSADRTQVLLRTSGTKQGTSIKHLSNAPEEDEVAISQNARWVATSVKKQGSMYIVDCQEV